MIPQLDYTKAHAMLGNPYPEPASPWNKTATAMGLAKKPIKLIKIKDRPTPLKFTQAVRAQLVAADILYSLVVNYEPGDPSNNQAGIAAAGALAAIQSIQKIHWGGDDPYFSAEGFRTYSHLVDKVHYIIKHSTGDTVSYEFFNACLMVADDMSCEVKKAKDSRLHEAWDKLVRFVRAMYLFEDPHLYRMGAMKRGNILAQELQAAFS